MKVLLVNQNWLRAELEEAGYEIFSVSLSNEGCNVRFPRGGLSVDEVFKSFPAGFIPEKILYWDDSNVSWISGLEELRIPKLFYSVDVHHHHAWHPHFSAIFDKVLVAQKDFVEQFLPYSPETQWVPLWATQPPFPEQERDLNTVFVGTLNDTIHPKRREFFEAVMRLTKVDVFQGDYRPYYARAKIVLNQVVSGDLNFRTFEALNGGALLVTPRIQNGLLELFGDGQDIVCYEDGNPKDAAEKIEFYLANEPLRREIAERGSKKVRELHSCKARAARIISELEQLKEAPKPQRNFGAAYSYLVAYLTCKYQNIPWGSVLLKPAQNAFLRCSNLTPGDQIGTAILLATYLTEEKGPEHALTFLEHALRGSPGCIALELAVIQKLIELNRQSAAIERARRISPEPERLCQGVGDALRAELSRA